MAMTAMAQVGLLDVAYTSGVPLSTCITQL